ncbi:hypothetical protein FJY90_01755 [Candidatus Gottesmanbacteria bacterium]|nr:hypothetical protein [Candidatus Gottesmanbacteria bacterium]
MVRETLRIIGLNPGTRYLGLAIFCGSELRDWQVKNTEGKWSQDKMTKITSTLLSLIDSYGANVLAVKRINPSRSSPNLNKLATQIENLSKVRKLRIYHYSIDEIKRYFQQRSRKGLAEIIAAAYPVLYHELKKEQTNLNPYYIRMFEAVALGSMCLQEVERRKLRDERKDDIGYLIRN